MNIKILMISLLTMLFTANLQAFDDVIYIAGSKHSINKQAFSQSGSVYTAKIPVSGDYGQQLIFDIDARISGNGAIDTGFECHKLYPQPGGYFLIGAGNPPDCTYTTVNPSNQFRFIVEMNAYCSNIAIGTDMDNRNALLTAEQVTAIKNSVNSYGFIVGNPYNTYRSLNLLVDNTLVTNGNCQELTIEVKGLEQTHIGTIDMDILIGEVF
ncbi:hypothetical protein [Thalassomonas actiniarum]|uniref:Uncharacterized protein n=1 Tax=Thalassomonas actiniarum TaxID=485447 RepID=A0AAF0C163_9GAMM|nr:hypothetical protein [Thalassomonas actiniarum]WDD98706.1 hypothetical protein SG35_026265 [Thalassomonas actiniarum]